uniref:RNA helicase n=1 Tax=Culex tarsalis TaxID=7177 RepID=A0A1Q3FX64_CULTA
MFRLLSVLKGVLIAPQESQEEKIRRLEAQIADEDEVDGGEAERKRLEEQRQLVQVKPTNCFQQTGSITKVEADYVVIDGSLYVKKKVLQDFSFRQQLEVGSRVSYLAYRSADDDEFRVTKLECILSEGWGEDNQAPTKVDEENVQLMKELAPTYFNFNQRSEQGTIIAKRSGLLTVETDLRKIPIEMDNVELTYIPEMGDYVVLECMVQIDESFFDTRGDILEVKKISPTRLVRGSGYVSKANDCGGEIMSDDGTYYYCVENCEDASKPNHGDRVIFEAVENAELTYRCTKVVIEKAAPKSVETAKAPQAQREPDFFDDKKGIKITDQLQVKLNELNECKKIDVIIKNEARNQHKILFVSITGGRQTSQLTLLSPLEKEHFIKPGDSIKYSFEVTAKNFGISKEIVYWRFGGQFKIGRCITIAVGDSDIILAQPTKTGTTQARTQAVIQRLAAWNEYKHGGEVTPGQKISKRANFIDIKIGGYQVPFNLKEILLNPSFTKNQIDEELMRTQRCLQVQAITPDNYKALFKLFLWMEDIQCEITIKKFNLDRAHFTREEGYLALRIENVGETRPSLIPGDRLVASAPCNNRMEAGNGAVIHKVQKHKILVKFSEHFHDKYNGEDYKVTFQHSRGAFQKQHHAINCVTSTMTLDYLFPTKTTIREPWVDVKINEKGNLATTGFDNEFEWFNPTLNHIQKDAIKNIIRAEARPLPYVIFGPPGTGKTMTLIELIHQIVKLSADSRIMVGTPSNSSANLITERLINANVLRPGEFIRIVGLNYVEQELIPEHLAPYCGTVDIASERTVKGEVITTKSGLKQNIQLKHLGRHRITIGTCVTLGTLMQMRFPHNHFTHILVDEAGQCLETETLIPITFINKNCGTVVLAGDPQQLGPIVMSPHARGFEQSLLVRLMDTPLYKSDKNRFPDTAGFNPRLVTKLRYNYRSLPCILDLYSELFYDKSLIACVRAENSKESAFLDQVIDTLPIKSSQTPPYGFIFCGVNGVNKQSPDSPSWFNPAETKSVFNFLLKLYKKGVRSEDIGIITPYQAQVKQIRRILDESGYGGSSGLAKPKIGSVEEFQGQERQVIIISTVRTSKSMLPNDLQHALGFVASPKRLNVAISRAKSLLVIFGNPHLLSADKKWLELLFKAINNGMYCGCELPDHLAPVAREQALLNGGNHAQEGKDRELD